MLDPSDNPSQTNLDCTVRIDGDQGHHDRGMRRARHGGGPFAFEVDGSSPSRLSRSRLGAGRPPSAPGSRCRPGRTGPDRSLG